ncbi:MAG: tRNA pseudouridine(38-40) synthase TruA [Chitinispirillales bacterium]|jgi:tRNA pseudouridine38-40 synthase|nr:tRNA pseudouridine(38-40) synthase TruA [Chitinispirillales bacterium]
MRYFFRTEYDGTRFHGWQNQPDGVSVQRLIEEALSVALRAPCPIVGAGRTDAGVHARAQGAHFDAPDSVDIDTDRLTVSVNALLPPDIAVYGMVPVRPDFHARYSAVSRRYIYYFSDRKSPINYKRVWMIYYPVDWERIASEAKHIVGRHDFTAFCASGADSDDKECDVASAALSLGENGVRTFTIEANRFIYKMVRSLVGTLVDIGRGRLSAAMDAIIGSRDRSMAGETAPACGLVLEWVGYPPAERL